MPASVNGIVHPVDNDWVNLTGANAGSGDLGALAATAGLAAADAQATADEALSRSGTLETALAGVNLTLTGHNARIATNAAGIADLAEVYEGMDPARLAELLNLADLIEGGLDLTDGSMATIIGTEGTTTRAALNADYATRDLGLAAGPTTLTATTQSGAPTPLASFDGYLWGQSAGNIHRSANNGETWQPYANGPGDTILRLIKTDDGEVVVIRGTNIYKSTGWATGSPTWSSKVTANGAARFNQFTIDGDGAKFIASQYGPGNTGSQAWIDSRYVHISTDAGTTWTLVYDSVDRYGASAANISHLHGVCYDPWADRFYVSEGHGPLDSSIAGLYASADDGTTWTRAPGMIAQPAPTVIVATDDGLVCGSDNDRPGIYGVTRTGIATQELRRTWAWRTGADGVVGFGMHGSRDPRTGVVYISFYTSITTAPPVIAGGTAAAAGLAWTWPATTVAVADVIEHVVHHDDSIHARARINGSSWLARGPAGAPVSGTLLDTGNASAGTAEGTSVAVGPGADVPTSTLRSVAIGADARMAASRQDNTVVGHAARATGSETTVIGQAATGAGNAIAIGKNSAASGEGVAVGVDTTTGGGQSVAVGRRAASQTQGVAIGYNSAIAPGVAQGVVVGGYATVTGPQGSAFGTGADATAASATALGYNAEANHSRSVALGATAVTTAANQVKVANRHIEFDGLASSPVAGTPGSIRLYGLLNSDTGKVSLRVRFPTGVTQEVVAEP